MSWIEPIFDRTLEDVTEETSKGFFNVVDWIRINGNTKFTNLLINKLKELNIVLDVLEEPTITSIPTVSDINRFVSNIERIRKASGVPLSTGLVKLKDDYTGGLAGLTPDYEDVNDWERDLEILRNYLLTSMGYIVYSGVARSGQSRLWQVRFRRWNLVLPVPNPDRRPRTAVAISGTSLTRQNSFRRYTHG